MDVEETHTATSPTVERLLKSFFRFRRAGWRQSPIANLTAGEILVLSCVRQATADDDSGIKVSDISSRLAVAAPTVTQQINELESRGLVVRGADPEDRRAVRIRLTGKGECAVEKAMDSFHALFGGLVEYLGEEDSNKLADLMTRVFTYFHEVRQPDL